MPRLIAKWNPARDVWETPQTAICGHSDVYSEIFPSSGSMRSGGLYPQPAMPVEYTDVPGSSYLLTPVASEVAKGTFQQGTVRRATTGQLFLVNQLRDIYEASIGDGTAPTSNAGSAFTEEPLPLSSW